MKIAKRGKIIITTLIVLLFIPATQVHAATTPAKPEISSVSASGKTITVAWKKADNAKSYSVYAQKGNDKWKLSKSVKKTSKNKTKYSNTMKYKLKASGKKYKVYKNTNKYSLMGTTTSLSCSFDASYSTKYKIVVQAVNDDKIKNSAKKTITTKSASDAETAYVQSILGENDVLVTGVNSTNAEKIRKSLVKGVAFNIFIKVKSPYTSIEDPDGRPGVQLIDVEAKKEIDSTMKGLSNIIYNNDSSPYKAQFYPFYRNDNWLTGQVLRVKDASNARTQYMKCKIKAIYGLNYVRAKQFFEFSYNEKNSFWAYDVADSNGMTFGEYKEALTERYGEEPMFQPTHLLYGTGQYYNAISLDMSREQINTLYEKALGCTFGVPYSQLSEESKLLYASDYMPINRDDTGADRSPYIEYSYNENLPNENNGETHYDKMMDRTYQGVCRHFANAYEDVCKSLSIKHWRCGYGDHAWIIAKVHDNYGNEVFYIINNSKIMKMTSEAVIGNAVTSSASTQEEIQYIKSIMGDEYPF